MQQLTNAEKKLVSSLGQVKSRRESGLFVAEGTRCVLEALPLFACRYLLATEEWLRGHGEALRGFDVIQVWAKDMERMSQQKAPQGVLAVLEIPRRDLDVNSLKGKLTVALDSVQDPGNLGTIVRLCSWFGVKTLLCSKGCADVYNPKVVQSTMGALGRVAVHYCDLEEVLPSVGEPIYGTFLDGKDLFHTPLTSSGVIVMGNEGNGVSPGVARLVSHRLYIPPYPADAEAVESLNVATATAITLARFRNP
ncbi:MAG: RNA methyltransferase [Bacteroidales bacterium]|nr:RNA methyltransferase [Bacteroidales bacterium]MCD8395144.1 RNA methyltransferase [Bacteroidales bacterium]